MKTITPELLASIKVLYRDDGACHLYGIPHEMRPGQSPRDIVRARRQGREAFNDAPWAVRQHMRTPGPPIPEDWIWLQEFGALPGLGYPAEALELIAAFLERNKERVPLRPCEFDTVPE